MNFKYWVVSSRPGALFVGAGPVWLGGGISLAETGDFKVLLNGAVLLCVLCIQTASHFFNDALDFAKKADSPQRLGPKRPVQMGQLAPRQVMKAGVWCLMAAAVLGSYLVFKGGGVILGIGVLSLALAYLYTGGPWPLASSGWSDVFVLLFFGVIPVSAVYYLNTGRWSLDSVFAGLQCGFLALSLLLVNHLRDWEEDKKSGKKTLVVRLGLRFGLAQFNLVRYAPYVLSLYWAAQHKYLIAFAPFCVFPLSFFISSFLWKAFKQHSLFPKVFGLTCLYHFLFTGCLLFGFLQNAGFFQ